jgi:hypothetical protein
MVTTKTLEYLPLTSAALLSFPNFIELRTALPQRGDDDRFHLSMARYRQAMYRYVTFRFHLSWPYIDMPRLGSTSHGHISICHVFHCRVTHITIRGGTITPRIPLPCHPHPQYVMAPSRHVFHCYHSLHRARKTSCHKFTHSRVIFQITLGDSVIDASL